MLTALALTTILNNGLMFRHEPREITGNTPQALAESLHRFNLPVFIASAPLNIDYKLVWTKEEMGEKTELEYVQSVWKGSTSKTPIEGMVSKDAFIARPRWHYPNVKDNFQYLGDQKPFVYGLHIPNYPATQVEDFQVADGLITHEKSSVASMTADNFKRLFPGKLKLHWLIERTWVTIDMQSMPIEDFLRTLARATGGKLKKDGDTYEIELDPEFARSMSKGTLEEMSKQQHISDPQSRMEPFREESLRINLDIIDAYSDEEILKALAHPNLDAPVYKDLENEQLKDKMKELLYSMLTVENSIFNIPPYSADYFLKRIMWDSSDWRAALRWPFIERKAPEVANPEQPLIKKYLSF